MEDFEVEVAAEETVEVQVEEQVAAPEEAPANDVVGRLVELGYLGAGAVKANRRAVEAFNRDNGIGGSDLSQATLDALFG